MKPPLATYRLQLHKDFPFAAARAVVPYLSRLGVSHLYASPVFKARAGSLHGYDVVDPTVINPELGGEEGFKELSAALRGSGLSIMQDIVPNHMAYDSENVMLMDVLEKGPRSASREFFDVDWDHAYENLRGRLLTPFLGSFYGEALENGELRLAYSEAGLTLDYYRLRLPLRMESYIEVFGRDLAPLEAVLGPDAPELANYIGTVSLLKNLAAAQGETSREGQFLHAKKMLWTLYTGVPQIKSFMDGELVRLSGEKGNSDSFDALDEIVSEQFYRPSYWKVAAEEINYRRFFTINELISLRIEDPQVFDYVHGTALRLVKEGAITAFRVDHVDGLMDPERYLTRLRQAVGPDVYLAVEKILAPGEDLPAGWAIQGTTGYDFTNYANGVFCRRENEKEFSRSYYRFTGIETPFEELVCAKKRMIISKHLAGNIDNLANIIKKASANDRYGRDITLYGLRRALVEVMANFPVYRTYINTEAGPAGTEKDYIRTAAQKAREKLSGFGYELNFIEAFLLMGEHRALRDENKKDVLAFVMNFQQYTAPLMAKGFEDTILYIYNKLTSLNEVGSAPNLFGFTLEQFHEFSRKRAEAWPLTMNTTSTHDTKRAEDVRARINVLSEMPKEWNTRLQFWAKLNLSKKRRRASGAEMPDRNDEYLIYQSLLGACPFEGPGADDFSGRMKAYSVKAAREAQINTNWIKPDTEYEEALATFIDKALAELPENRFLEDFNRFRGKIAFYGAFNSLSQTLLKIAAPGLPDFYQGAELWDLSLVDPDNRRPVDFAAREKMLAAIETEHPGAPEKLLANLLADLPSGRAKLFLAWRALAVRRELREVFEKGGYTPLAAEGAYKESLIAFTRSLGDRHVLVAAPRFVSGLTAEGAAPLGNLWKDTRLLLPPGLPGSWTETLSGKQLEAGGELRAADLFRHFPCALLSGGKVPGNESGPDPAGETR
ncbi:MAG: malto-oligosyltrehalose synthase [Elusimicrobia bacterium CG08_land_8_20_14_0_20_59_10]|nr:MAG: malto-oligosyltrehalose synthase [Elusimicrobia bacterium CG08_land_8_20_14_0_20_59_10]